VYVRGLVRACVRAKLLSHLRFDPVAGRVSG
jgi:hypothetical protein